jgi:hypothetical protein
MEKVHLEFKNAGLNFDEYDWVQVSKTDLFYNSVLDSPGIYMFTGNVKDRSVLYIGRSSCVSGRLKGHPVHLILTKLEIEFNVHVLYCRKGQEAVIENFLLGSLNPLLNTARKHPYVSLQKPITAKMFPSNGKAIY